MPKSKKSPRRKLTRQQKWRARATGLVLALVIIGIVSVTTHSGTVTQDDALQNLINKINDGPSWETQQDSNGVAEYLKWETTDNGNDGGAACAYLSGTNPKAGFACYLQASAANGGTTSYYRENGPGGDIHPISDAQYNELVGLG